MAIQFRQEYANLWDSVHKMRRISWYSNDVDCHALKIPQTN
ncbi:hypothetical protein THF1C08_370012 [Vibrio jasicida]|uniref:Uncharacterized protein n=1 Tax=Vibrio jasicida TaxID=766224 RepID=A0AAU9QRM5_9VIBR|nr:hypothetical protein THF1C08_370012 [Vibrio jasicida]CAH1598564.1 hypothetical protein THF1A12_370012 [Vibrio jasicida]